MACRDVVLVLALGATVAAAWATVRSSSFEAFSGSMARVNGLIEPQAATLSGGGKMLTYFIPPGVGPGRLRIRWAGRCDPTFVNVVDLEGAADEQWQETWIVAANGSGDSQVELLSNNPRPWGGRWLEIVPSAHCQAGTAQLDLPAQP